MGRQLPLAGHTLQRLRVNLEQSRRLFGIKQTLKFNEFWAVSGGLLGITGHLTLLGLVKVFRGFGESARVHVSLMPTQMVV